MNEFPDVAKQFQWMKIRDRITDALIWDKTLWGDTLRLALDSPNYSIQDICKQIIADYRGNDKLIIDILGKELITSIKNLLQ